jgi:hypothetical protein
MKLSKTILDNLRFLIAEVSSQVNDLQSYFESGSPLVAQHILDRGGYSLNLKQRIHDSSLSQIVRKKVEGIETLSLRSTEVIATDLERIAELSRDCIKQLDCLKGRRKLVTINYIPLLDIFLKGIRLIEFAIQENGVQTALKIGKISKRLGREYKRSLSHYMLLLKDKKMTEDFVSALFVARNIGQMGETLLDISEAIISANLGQSVNTDRYYSLQASVAQLDLDQALPDIKLEAVAQTRSGSAISGISYTNSENDGYLAIYKDGKKRKLKEERQGVESWHEIYPGLAPKILSYQRRGQSAALLIEYLAGLTFEQILLHESPQILQESMDQLSATLTSVWRETENDKQVSANFMQQLGQRLDEIYSIHPEFCQSDSSICGYSVFSFNTLIEQAKKYETQLKLPFSVYIHGDFNVDNIIYDPMEKRINFIDLHRSRYMDYVQDISVFMVSNYRLQILSKPLRKRILKVAQEFYYFAAAYAHKKADKTFELRLALGLARSFATSTRFILDKSLARAMFLRARYLIELVLSVDPKCSSRFKIPIEEIFVG